MPNKGGRQLFARDKWGARLLTVDAKFTDPTHLTQKNDYRRGNFVPNKGASPQFTRGK